MLLLELAKASSTQPPCIGTHSCQMLSSVQWVPLAGDVCNITVHLFTAACRNLTASALDTRAQIEQTMFVWEWGGSALFVEAFDQLKGHE